MINRKPGSRHLISSLPGSALRTHVESPSKHCLVNLISKDVNLAFSICIRNTIVKKKHEDTKIDMSFTTDLLYREAGYIR